MAVLELTKIGNPVLRKKCQEVKEQDISSGKYKKLIADMIDTMRDAKGVGLAANQVGVDLKLIVLECAANPRYPGAEAVPLAVYFNPRITGRSGQGERAWEGCLSIPGYRGVVARSREITFEAVTPEGRKVRETVKGFHARIIQHEVDHVEGCVYMDRMEGVKEWMHLDEFNRDMETKIKDKP